MEKRQFLHGTERKNASFNSNRFIVERAKEEVRVIYMIVREDRQRKDYRCRLSEGNRRGPCDRLRDNL